MLVMVLDGTFHNTDERGLLGNKIKKTQMKCCTQMSYI